MKSHPSFLLAAGFALVLLTAARAAETTTSTLKFSDPARPGTLKLQLARGDVTITGADSAEVTVRSQAQPANQVRRKDGLRVLTASSGYAFTEKDNVIVLDAAADGWQGPGTDFTISVPRNTHVIVQSSFGGDIVCSDIGGDIEINSMHGEVRLDGLSGGALVSTMNGEITATIAKLQDNKPLSFTSMNGEVLVRAPADAKANVRLRTHNGSILTDFEESALVTKVENTPRSARVARVNASTLPPEAREAIREAARVGAEVAREAALIAREAVQAARAGAAGDGNDLPVPPTPPKPPIPPVTGGKLVSGALNGGGVEISVATMNGDVTLRKIAKP